MDVVFFALIIIKIIYLYFSYNGCFQARPRDKKKGRGPPRHFAPPAPTKKDRFEDNEVVKIEIDESLFSR